ncbi:alpha/beta hydrolase fold domain-containing protein [Streptomyces gardneri]|uniref:alpha/beta hydrolase fold domain-containing protein n=1 Tax=Streptomyces gardneri TaxID=66892 RepID=UPI0036AB0049
MCSIPACDRRPARSAGSAPQRSARPRLFTDKPLCPAGPAERSPGLKRGARRHPGVAKLRTLTDHGAGWVFGNARTHNRLAREPAVGARAVVVFPEYARRPKPATARSTRPDPMRAARGIPVRSRLLLSEFALERLLALPRPDRPARVVTQLNRAATMHAPSPGRCRGPRHRGV